MKKLFTLLLMVGSLTLVGCGGSGPGATVEELAYAMEDGDAEKLKELMPELGENLGDSKIETMAKQTAKETKEKGGIESVTIDKEEIDGDTAKVTATMKMGDGTSETEDFELEKKDGKWVISLGEDAKGGGAGLPTPDINLNGGGGGDAPDFDLPEPPSE